LCLSSGKNVQRLVIGTMALVLVTGLIMPVYSQVQQVGESSLTAGTVNTLADEDNVVFDGGSSDFVFAAAFDGWPDGASAVQSIAVDFELEADTSITDIHFDVLDFGFFTDSFHVIFYADDNGLPGDTIIAERDAFNIHREDLGDGQSFRYWIDINPVPLDDQVRYWLEIEQQSDFNVGWWSTAGAGFGNLDAFRSDGTGGVWTDLVTGGGPPAINFVLTASPSPAVGGELLPIDTTALLLVGSQMNAAWMIPVIVSAIGIGIVIARKF